MKKTCQASGSVQFFFDKQSDGNVCHPEHPVSKICLPTLCNSACLSLSRATNEDSHCSYIRHMEYVGYKRYAASSSATSLSFLGRRWQCLSRKGRLDGFSQTRTEEREEKGTLARIDRIAVAYMASVVTMNVRHEITALYDHNPCQTHCPICPRLVD